MNCLKCKSHRLRNKKALEWFDSKNQGRLVKRTVEYDCPKCGKVVFEVVGDKQPLSMRIVCVVAGTVAGFCEWMYKKLCQKYLCMKRC